MTLFAGDSYIVSFDNLPESILAAMKILERLPDSSAGSPMASWILRVARDLETIAIPLFTRRQRFDFEKVTSIRLAALLLAAEETCRGLKKGVELTNIFREIAAGITLLERRLSDQASATETIFVALA